MSNEATAPKPGDLRVWWIPQVPMPPFHVPVTSIADAARIMDLLARYDAFEFEQSVKGDYANVGGVERWCEDNGDGEPGWESWYDEETGEDDPRAWLAGQEADKRFDIGDWVRFQDKWDTPGTRVIGAGLVGQIRGVIVGPMSTAADVARIQWGSGGTSDVHFDYLTHAPVGEA